MSDTRSEIRPCLSIDQTGWLELRGQLWPHADQESHLAEMERLLSLPDLHNQWIRYSESGLPEGFIETSLRHDYVNGANSSPVGFLEGIFVNPALRGRGIARELIETAMHWAKEQGCTEFLSDALLDNVQSHAMHAALGFEETERVVFFRKPLV